MANIDWNNLNTQYQPKYKEYAPAGTHKVKVAEVYIHEVGTKGSIAQDFKFEDSDEFAFPKATHWLSFKEGKDNWRQYHNKCLMVLLGASEDAAKKAVEMCESKGDKENIVKAYIDAYKRLAAKKPSVEIEVWQDGKYKVAEFTDGSVRMSHPETTEQTATPSDDLFAESATTETEDFDIPF